MESLIRFGKQNGNQVVISDTTRSYPCEERLGSNQEGQPLRTGELTAVSIRNEDAARFIAIRNPRTNRPVEGAVLIVP